MQEEEAGGRRGGDGDRQQDVFVQGRVEASTPIWEKYLIFLVQASLKVRRRQLGCLWNNQLASHGTRRPRGEQVVGSFLLIAILYFAYAAAGSS